MFQPLDIFKTDSDGSVLWRGAVESLVAAKLRIQRLALFSPGEYLIVDQHTGDRVGVVEISTAATASGALTAATS